MVSSGKMIGFAIKIFSGGAFVGLHFLRVVARPDKIRISFISPVEGREGKKADEKMVKLTNCLMRMQNYLDI